VFIGNTCLAQVTCEAIVPERTTAKLGEKAVFKCRQTSQNIAWTFCSKAGKPRVIVDNCNVVESAVGDYGVDKSNNGCNLVINNVTVDDLGTYTCQDLSINDKGHSAELGNTNENLAMGKNAIQTTTYDANSQANKAVDGNRNSNFYSGSCSATLVPGTKQWWAVDLGQETPVGRVTITNRGDASPELFNNFFLGLTNVSPWVSPPDLTKSSICKYHAGFPAGGYSVDIFCERNTKPGRYLFMQMTTASPFALCEVEAYYE
jgi:hypothetical protein